MKRVCAWCGRELDQSERFEDAQVTHGVCQDCRRRFFDSARAKEASSRSPVEDVEIADANTRGQVPTE